MILSVIFMVLDMATSNKNTLKGFHNAWEHKIPDEEERCCDDCYYFRGFVTWHCISEEDFVKPVRGMYRDCEYWKPCPHVSEINVSERTFVDGE